MRVSLKILIAAVTSTSLCFATVTMFGGQNDPGIRRGPAGAGHALAGLPPQSPELAFFSDPGLSQFTQVEAVTDGLGPRFNLDSCAGCHIFPAVGGSSPPTNNPQVIRAPTMAPGSTVPSFLHIDGPIREVRFIRKTNGTDRSLRPGSGQDDDGGSDDRHGALDGQVHAIFTIVGRSDNPAGCEISQPNFSNTSNLIFRIQIGRAHV